MELIKNNDSAGVFASNNCSSGCTAGCTAEQKATSNSNASTKVKGANDHNNS